MDRVIANDDLNLLKKTFHKVLTKYSINFQNSNLIITRM